MDQITQALPPSSERTLPPTAAAAGSPAAVAVPGYEILGELGRGGMGVVYQARQVGLDRVVALKMILAGGHADDAGRGRFRAEAEAIARLQHPNIVQVHEVGSHDGHPYFSLEFCDGGSLEKRLGGNPLPAKEAAALVATLARAMQAAHDRGVVHRDLKPANVLLCSRVSPRREEDRVSERRDYIPKITDFGLARRLDQDSGQTRTGAILGTPSYMAPEQAEARKDVGPACDIYALGAILYECLTGRPPFKAATPLDTIFQVVADDPIPPSRFQPGLPRDLETVCLKCLEKDPARRYATASDLADELDRFQAGEPVRARPTPWWERAVKWGRRRPAAAALLAVTVAAAGLLTAVGLAYQARLRRTNADLAAALDTADQQHRLAEGRLAKSLEAVDRMLTRVGDERLAKVPQFAGLRRQLLEEAVDFYRGFLVQESGEPAVRREAARACFRIARLHFGLGRVEDAERACQEAAALQEQLVADFPDQPDYQHDLATSHGYLGHVYASTARYGPSVEAFTRGLEIDERLSAAHPDKAEYAEGVATAHNNLGYFNGFLDARKAEGHFKTAAAVAERLARDHPDAARFRALLATCQTSLGAQLVRTGRLTEAGEALERGRAALGGDGSAAAAAKNEVWRGVHLARLRRHQEAEASLRQGIAAYERLLKDGGDEFAHRYEMATGCLELAQVLDAAGREGPAADAWREAIAQAERMTRDYPAFKWVALAEDRTRVRSLVTPARRGRVGEVVPQAKALAAKPALAGDVCYDLACVFALAAGASGGPAAEEYAAAAVGLLRRAAAGGYFRRTGALAHAARDDDLKAVRARDDFRAVLAGAGK